MFLSNTLCYTTHSCVSTLEVRHLFYMSSYSFSKQTRLLPQRQFLCYIFIEVIIYNKIIFFTNLYTIIIIKLQRNQ